MGMSLAFDNHFIQSVATTMGWNYFSRWVSNLSSKECPNLCHLIHYGYSAHLPEIEKEIRLALKLHPIHDPSLKSTIDGIIKLIQRNEHSARLVMVSNGMVPSPRNFQKRR